MTFIIKKLPLEFDKELGPCEIFDDGEVEDYTVNIQNSGNRSVATNTADNPTSLDFSVYPNPSSKIINVRIPEQLENGQYQIMDMNGKVISQERITPSINVENLETGIYFIRIFDTNKNYIKKFVKTKI